MEVALFKALCVPRDCSILKAIYEEKKKCAQFRNFGGCFRDDVPKTQLHNLLRDLNWRGKIGESGSRPGIHPHRSVPNQCWSRSVYRMNIWMDNRSIKGIHKQFSMNKLKNKWTSEWTNDRQSCFPGRELGDGSAPIRILQKCKIWKEYSRGVTRVKRHREDSVISEQDSPYRPSWLIFTTQTRDCPREVQDLGQHYQWGRSTGSLWCWFVDSWTFHPSANAELVCPWQPVTVFPPPHQLPLPCVQNIHPDGGSF